MTYKFTGDRIDIAGQVLRCGDSIELSPENAAELIANDFPFVPVSPATDITTNRAEPKEEVTDHVAV